MVKINANKSAKIIMNKEEAVTLIKYYFAKDNAIYDEEEFKEVIPIWIVGAGIFDDASYVPSYRYEVKSIVYLEDDNIEIEVVNIIEQEYNFAEIYYL